VAPRHTRVFVGIDWSGLALLVATRTCPERAVFLHPRERRAIRRWAGKVDSVVCRHFVIHQNMERMRGLLAFEAAILAVGGRVYADFWLDNPAIHEGRGVFDALDDPAGRCRTRCFGSPTTSSLSWRPTAACGLSTTTPGRTNSGGS